MTHRRQRRGTGTSDPAGGLLEREQALATLVDATVRARSGDGTVVGIEGEPGIGKTALVDRFHRDLPVDAVVVAGGCDDLSIPRPLGPFVDAALTGVLAPVEVESAERLQVRLRQLAVDGPLTVVIVEDVQWADAATLDTIAYLARRIRTSRSVLVITFRPDVEPASHVRRALAATPADSVRHVRLVPLSPDSVAELVGASPHVDLRHVQEVTGGNPFLVTEMLRSGDRVPATVRDSVASRMGGLGKPARRLASCLSVVPGTASWELVERIEPEWEVAVDELEAANFVAPAASGVEFIHELVRSAVEDNLSATARRRHHRTILDALRATDGHPADVAHHAAALGDVELLVAASTEACERAAAAGAHVEALAHVERILPHVDRMSAADRHQFARIASYEYSINHRLAEAIAFAEHAVETSDSVSERSAALSWLSLTEWWIGRIDESRRHLAESVEVLGGASPPTALLRRVATDLAHRSSWRDAWTWAMRALEQAEGDGDEQALGQALSAAEMVGAVVDDPVLARRRGDRAIAIYRREGMQRDLWIAVGNRVASDINTLRIRDAAGALDAALALDDELDVASYRSWLSGQRSRYCLYVGAWDEARELAEQSLIAIPDGLHRATPLMVLALLTARCDGPVPDPLEDAARLVGTSDDIQRVGNLTIAIAELAWLGSEVDETWIDHAVGLAADSGHQRYVAELAVWNHRLGRRHAEVVDDGPAALVAELAGDWRTAATEWEALGCPYERALSLTFSGDPDAMREAVHAVTELGAHRTADRIRQMLRGAGVNLTRGPRAATRRNVAALTNRQVEVAELLAAGLTNAGIADRLFVSTKTVDHHVSAVLGKLGVGRRGDVAAALRRLADRT